MMWWNHGGWGVGDWLAMSLMMVVFWGLVIALVVRLVGSPGDAPTQAGAGRPPEGTPDALLAERFARGEIDAEEFTAGRELLHSGSRRSRRDVRGQAGGQS